MSSLKNFFLELNVFESSVDNDQEQDVQQRRMYILASRIYFIILISVLTIVGIVSSLVRQTTSITIQYPTIDHFNDLPYDANCPCSQNSVPYAKCIFINANFHQVCSSDFVTDLWIKTISSDSNSTYFHPQDFRTYGSAQFQLLANICALFEITIMDGISVYLSNSLFSPYVFSQDLLQSEMQASLDRFKASISNDLKVKLQLIRRMTMSNRLISGLETNNIPIYENIENDRIRLRFYPMQYQDSNGSICDCATTLDCVAISVIFNIFNESNQFFDINDNSTWMKVPGISSGCLPVNSILLSTLECFYNQTCVNQLVTYFSTNETFTAMNDTEPSQFSSSSLIQSIVEELMIEYWTQLLTYDTYYDQCSPASCTYTKLERNSFVFVLTQLISILGGMTVVLGIIIPMPIRSIQRPQNTEQSSQTSGYISLSQMKTMVFKIVLELNWYKHYPSNDRQLRYQRYATRVYILLVLGSLIIMAFYISLNKVVYRQTILNPTQYQYEDLQQTFPNTLSCPCTSMSIYYSELIEIQPYYHQLCSSDFTSSVWTQYLSMNLLWNHILLPWDYRILSSNLFSSLSRFCIESQQTIENSLNSFYQQQFISSQVVSKELFQIKIQSSIKDWQTTVVNQYLQTIELVQAITHGNQLMNDINFDSSTDTNSEETILKPKIISNCSCAVSSSCRTNMAIYQYDPYSNNISELFRIPNFFLSCLPIDGLLVSTLECFYNRSCMLEIDKYMYQSLGNAFSFSPLDENLNNSTEAIESIVNRMMVDNWQTNISFTSYYIQCAPQSCIYEYTGRKSTFSVITSIIGVFGGLTLAFDIFVLIILRSIEKTVIVRMPDFNLRQFIRNIFRCNDEKRIIKQVHFVLVVISFSTLYIFTAFTSKLIIVDINNPSLETFEDLLLRFPASLQCPCSQISIKYESWISITSSFHQVCQSDFISDRWITYLYDNNNSTDFYIPTDFLYSASAQFQLLASLCQLSQQTVNDSLRNLLTGDFISNNLLPMSLLQAFTSATIDEFQSTILSKSFLSTLILIRQMTSANMIMTTLSTNWVISVPSVINNMSRAHTIPVVYQECSCALSSECVQSSRNMYAGCYPLEALLQATFQCLYDQQCIDPTNNFQAMNISQPTNFDINTSIEFIVNNLMIETFFSTASYSSYFMQCAPSSCQYSYIETKNAIDGLTNLISLYGGMMVICQVIAVVVVKLLQTRIHRVQPMTN